MHVQEFYVPLAVAANTTTPLASLQLGGFLCVTSGTITVVANASGGQPARTIINAFPVSAGIYYPLPFYLGTEGGVFTTAGGASGTVAT